MKDALGEDLQTGDLVANIRTNSYGWAEASMVFGGVTDGRSIRLKSTFGFKRCAKQKCLVKICRDQFILHSESMIARMVHVGIGQELIDTRTRQNAEVLAIHDQIMNER